MGRPSDQPMDRGGEAAGLWDRDAVPAATVVVLRTRAELEVLLLQRSTSVSFAGGAWVFPGGRIDPTDTPEPLPTADLEAAARRAAVRETFEETGLVIGEHQLVRWSHWTPPERAGRRYTTAFFCAETSAASSGTRPGAAGGGADEVRVDGSEIVAHRWTTPVAAMAARDAGELTLTPPTYITLCQLARFGDASSALAAAAAGHVEHFATRIAVDGELWIALYHGDVAYESARSDPPAPEVLHAPGPRHRLVMGSSWSYERDERAPAVD